jgi:hypothetical protein
LFNDAVTCKDYTADLPHVRIHASHFHVFVEQLVLSGCGGVVRERTVPFKAGLNTVSESPRIGGPSHPIRMHHHLAHPNIQVEYLSNTATSLAAIEMHHSMQQLLQLLHLPQLLGCK